MILFAFLYSSWHDVWKDSNLGGCHYPWEPDFYKLKKITYTLKGIIERSSSKGLIKINVETSKLQNLKTLAEPKQFKIYKVVVGQTSTLVRLEVVYQKSKQTYKNLDQWRLYKHKYRVDKIYENNTYAKIWKCIGCPNFLS